MKRTRAGFTLTELLVVISLIALLSALGAAAYFNTIGSQSRKNSEATMNKFASILRQQYTRVIDNAKQETPSSALVAFAGDTDRARVILIKMRLKQQFPMTFAEAIQTQQLGSYTMPPEPAYVRALQNCNTSKTRPETQAAACLLMALTATDKRSAGNKADELGNLDTKDTDGDGMKELVDGYGNPLAFYRWPYGAVVVAQPPAAGGKYVDPEDPFGKLLVPAWMSNPNYTTFCNVVLNGHAVENKPVYPALVSWGPDQRLGITDLFMTTAVPADVKDNIVMPLAGVSP